MPLTSIFFSAYINFGYCSDHFGERIFEPGFFLVILYIFKVRKLGTQFFCPWTIIKENGFSFDCHVISVFNSHENRNISKRLNERFENARFVCCLRI